jgi:O-antigen ligase
MSGGARQMELGSRIRSFDWRTIDIRAIAEPIAIASPLALIISAQEPVMTTVALLFLAHSWRERDWGWVRRGWFLAALALWFYALLRTLLLNPTATGALTALQEIHFAIYAAALAEWILPRQQARDRLLWATIATVTFYSVDCLLQYAIGRDIIGRPMIGDRLTSVFGKPGVGAEIGWLYLPATMGLWRKGYPLAAAALGLACVAAVLLSGDRMGLLIALAAILLFAIVAGRRARKALVVALPVFAVLLGVVLYFNPEAYQRQVETTAQTIHRVDESVYGLVFLTSLRVARDHPLFGVGVRDYEAFCEQPKYGPLRVGSEQYKRCQGHPHNIYLQWLAETGIIGLVLYVAFAALSLKAVIEAAPAHRDDLLFIALAVCLALRFWPVATTTSFYSSWSTEPLFLILGWALSYCRPARDDP